MIATETKDGRLMGRLAHPMLRAVRCTAAYISTWTDPYRQQGGPTEKANKSDAGDE